MCWLKAMQLTSHRVLKKSHCRVSRNFLSLLVNVCQGFDSASTDTGTGQDGDKEDGDDTDEKDKQQTENRFVLLGGEIAILAY